MTDPRSLAARFAADFRFGVATAAFQIEGATNANGRGAVDLGRLFEDAGPHLYAP